MQTVWLLCHHGLLVGVFTTREKAESAAADGPSYCEFNIEELIVDVAKYA